jgi:hypothetical protein
VYRHKNPLLLPYPIGKEKRLLFDLTKAIQHIVALQVPHSLSHSNQLNGVKVCTLLIYQLFLNFCLYFVDRSY